MYAQAATSLNTRRLLRALLLALSVAAPWTAGIVAGHAQAGSIASFGAYLLIVSFPFLPRRRTWPMLLTAALTISGFAALGALSPLGSLAFFACAAMAATAQGVAELKARALRLPMALAALAFFLSVGQAPQGSALAYSVTFLGGTLWGVLVVFALVAHAPTQRRKPHESAPTADQQRFIAAMIGASMLGGAVAGIAPSAHPCWLPAAALRVLKPTRLQTLKRMRDRGVGSLAGAAFGGLLLGLYAAPWLKAGLVSVLVFMMMIVGAKRYAIWTFCLTAVSLAFNVSPETSAVAIATDRVLLTAGGLIIAALAVFVLPGSWKGTTDKNVVDKT